MPRTIGALINIGMRAVIALAVFVFVFWAAMLALQASAMVKGEFTVANVAVTVARMAAVGAFMRHSSPLFFWRGWQGKPMGGRFAVSVQ